MIVPRDDNDNYYYTYNPWGNWGRWVLLAIVIIIIIAICASFFVRRKQHTAAVPNQQEIPLGPVYPQDPTMANPPPPKYQPNGPAYMGPVWHGPQQQTYGEKGYGNDYSPPDGPPPPSDSFPSSSYAPPPGPPPAAHAHSTSDYYGPPDGAPSSSSGLGASHTGSSTLYGTSLNQNSANNAMNRM